MKNVYEVNGFEDMSYVEKGTAVAAAMAGGEHPVEGTVFPLWRQDELLQELGEEITQEAKDMAESVSEKVGTSSQRFKDAFFQEAMRQHRILRNRLAPVMVEGRKERLKHDMERWVFNAGQAKEQFESRMEEYGAQYAMEWSDKMFATTAQSTVGERVLRWLENLEDPELPLDDFYELCRHGVGEALRKGSHVKSSTSVPSNLAEQYESAAWCEVAGEMNRWLGDTGKEVK